MSEAAEANPAADDGPPGYFQQSKNLLNALILVLPLLVIYEGGLLLNGGKTLNGVDFITVFLLRQWGVTGILVFNGVLILAGLVGVVVLRKEGKFDPRIALPLVIECTVYAFLLGFVIQMVMGWLHIVPPMQTGPMRHGILARIFLSLGAGVNEELVFRLVMFGGLTWILDHFLPKSTSVIASVIVSSVLFSLAHYLGPHEDIELYSFMFRFLAGALFCGLLLTRGFAVAVYTHAIYDIYVMVFVMD